MIIRIFKWINDEFFHQLNLLISFLPDLFKVKRFDIYWYWLLDRSDGSVMEITSTCLCLFPAVNLDLTSLTCSNRLTRRPLTNSTEVTHTDYWFLCHVVVIISSKPLVMNMEHEHLLLPGVFPVPVVAPGLSPVAQHQVVLSKTERGRNLNLNLNTSQSGGDPLPDQYSLSESICNH